MFNKRAKEIQRLREEKRELITALENLTDIYYIYPSKLDDEFLKSDRYFDVFMGWTKRITEAERLIRRVRHSD